VKKYGGVGVYGSGYAALAWTVSGKVTETLGAGNLCSPLAASNTGEMHSVI